MGTGRFRIPGDELIGASRPMQELSALIARVAPHSMAVLVTGETGTGKELVARAIHWLGPRHNGPFVSVTCAPLGKALSESEIFGHVRGAFTDLTEDRAGVFERADGGTLLLDDVGDLPLSVQARLVNVIENGKVTRIGTNEPSSVDVRVIATTPRALDVEVAAGQFRGDLYYRLNVFQIRVAALRDRRNDIPLLIEHLLGRLSHSLNRPLHGVTAEAQKRLTEWSWPGNVRELYNVLASAALNTASDIIQEDDLPSALTCRTGASVTPIAELERAEVARAMAETHGNKMEAARRLGISRRALYRRLEKFGMTSKVAEAA
jgi:DNA-binding NtrC family response regulator